MTYLGISGVCLESMSHGSNGLGVIIVLSMHCAQQPPCIHIARLPLHLLPIQRLKQQLKQRGVQNFVKSCKLSTAVNTNFHTYAVL